ncbi:hypothetical protein [Sulfurimonas sp.]|uniref:hypothetical protein n=1 Tax=Sulfurimonas sp. TaxID=2022749 RepID=UPI0025DD5DEC|nr:hypothetical protein [Sulfurimonas sp.]
MHTTQPNRTPRTCAEFLDILKSNNGNAENIEVSEDAILTITKDFPNSITIRHCSFNKIVIEKDSLELTIGDCDFDELYFHVNAIKKLSVFSSNFNSIGFRSERGQSTNVSETARILSNDLKTQNLIRVDEISISQNKKVGTLELNYLDLSKLSFSSNMNIKECEIEYSRIKEFTVDASTIGQLILTSIIDSLRVGSSEIEHLICEGIIPKIKIKKTLIDKPNRINNLRFSLMESTSIRIIDTEIELIQFKEFDDDFKTLFDVDLYRCNFSDTRVAIETIFHSITWTGVKWPTKLEKYDPIYLDGYSESFRLLKIEAVKQSNKKHELEFLALEMKAIKELNCFKWHKNLKNKLNKYVLCVINPFIDIIELFPKSDSNFEDKFIFFLGRYSNNFGLSWFRPLLLYLISTYLVIVCISNGYEFTSSFEFALLKDHLFYDYLIPSFKISDGLNAIIGEESVPTKISLLFLRVWQGFLIYQFIRAFRRFFSK